jgi:hypothetical protein
MLTHASEQRPNVLALRIRAPRLLPLYKKQIGDRIHGARSGGLGVDPAKRENINDLAAQNLADVAKGDCRVTAGRYDRMRPEFQNDRHGKKPVDDEILPENPISITPVGAHEPARPALHELAREREILGYEKVLGFREQLFQLENLG